MNSNNINANSISKVTRILLTKVKALKKLVAQVDLLELCTVCLLRELLRTLFGPAVKILNQSTSILFGDLSNPFALVYRAGNRV